MRSVVNIFSELSSEFLAPLSKELFTPLWTHSPFCGELINRRDAEHARRSTRFKRFLINFAQIMQHPFAARLGLQRILAESLPPGFASWFQPTQKRRWIAQARLIRSLRTRLIFSAGHARANKPHFQHASVTEGGYVDEPGNGTTAKIIPPLDLIRCSRLSSDMEAAPR